MAAGRLPGASEHTAILARCAGRSSTELQTIQLTVVDPPNCDDGRLVGDVCRRFELDTSPERVPGTALQIDPSVTPIVAVRRNPHPVWAAV